MNPQAIGPKTAGPAAGSVARVFYMAYGLIGYAAFFFTFLYAIGFVGNWVVPKGIDAGAPGPVVRSLLINAVLLSVFVLQHTIMARPAFKRWWTRFIPKPMERSTFVILASAALMLCFWQWRPLPRPVWEVTSAAGAGVLTALSLLGWGIVLCSSFMVSHWDLFGLRQSWFGYRGEAYRPIGFRAVGIYRLVRHPLMLGFLIAFWATPRMSQGHLFFSIMTTIYIFMGIAFEERDLVAELGEQYLSYKRSVRGLIPWPRRTP